MPIIAGVDIGNATTEVALARVENGSVDFISSSTVYTTGIKGTLQSGRRLGGLHLFLYCLYYGN